MLHSLELARRELADYFPIDLAGLTVVLHSSTASLWAARPLLPVAWVTTAPAARRYLAGWAGGHELHLLAPTALDPRASNVPGSREMLELTPVALYARRVIAENNHDLPRRLGPAPDRRRAALGVADRGRRALVRGPDRLRPAGDRAAAA